MAAAQPTDREEPARPTGAALASEPPPEEIDEALEAPVQQALPPGVDLRIAPITAVSTNIRPPYPVLS